MVNLTPYNTKEASNCLPRSTMEPRPIINFPAGRLSSFINITSELPYQNKVTNSEDWKQTKMIRNKLTIFIS